MSAISVLAVITVALTIKGEAGVENYEGKMMVASVIYNRAKGDRDRFAPECTKHKQFSCWNNVDLSDSNISTMYDLMNDSDRSQQWKDCKAIAVLMFLDSFKPITKATHYYANYIKPPYWAESMKVVDTIGRHIFLV